jgi:DNA-binding NtrC family response regulator
MNEAARKPDRATVLFVDDEHRVLNSMRAMFRRDYLVLIADSGEAALNLVDTHPVDVIVSDQRMPSMTGVDVLREMKRRAPRAMRILLTGYADLNAIEASINEGEVFRYLTKPCPADMLREAIALAATAAGRASAAHPQTVPTRHNAPIPLRPRPTAARVTVHGRVAQPPRAAPAREHHHQIREDKVELLVLTRDPELTAQLGRVLHDARTWHKANTIEDAVALLESRPIGVLLTDSAVNERAIRGLTAELKRHVPQLVTIVASDRSDAASLIELINYGQIFRFLLKPFHPAQCRLWIDSAVKKHLELVAHPETMTRHRVVAHESPALGVISSFLARMRQIRQRFGHFEEIS